MQTPDTLPRGTVTFLFTDIEGSTALWERQRAAMRQVVERHLAILDEAIAAAGGVHFKTVGDAVQAAFQTAPDALEAAVAAQRALAAEPWPEEIGPLRVRMGLHTGTAQPAHGDYLAPALNRLSRMMGAGHGEQILVSAAARLLLSGELPIGVELLSLGAHALRDLQEPEEIFQVVAAGLPETFPPLRSLPRRPTNLTAPPTALIGRKTEVAAAVHMLREDDTRLVTLTGPGGSGKTRLALEVAAELLDAFPDGVYFVDLAPLRDPAFVVPAIAATLGVRETSREGLRDTLAAFLASKRLLLVLDNCEQVIEAAAEIAALLAASPTAAILATSREPLRVRAEREFPVSPLALPEEAVSMSLADLAAIPSVALFVARASANRPEFALSEENASAIAAIARRLDGLPLALELAAARARLLPPEALLARLERRLPLLTGGARDLPERQRTLRDTIAWSHDLLDEPERLIFRRLGVFAGGWTLEAAEAVANGDGDLDVMTGMERLVEQSLVRLDAHGAEPRYGMLETIREFAAEQLASSSEEAELRDAHAAYLLSIATTGAGPPVPGDLVDEAWAARMEREHDNLRTALTWWLDRDDGGRALRLAAAAGTFWGWHEHWTEGRAWLERALAIAPEGEPEARARAVAFVGSFAFAQGDSRSAIALLEPGLAVPDTPETRPWLMRTALKLAHAFGQVREFPTAMRHYALALDLATAMQARYLALEVRWSMAYTATSQGDLARAAEIATAVLADEQEAGDPLVVASTLELLAWIALAAGDLDGAASRLAGAWAAAPEIPPWAEGIRTNLLIDEAVLDYRRGDFAASAARVAAWLPRAREQKARADLLVALCLLASIASQLGPLEAAARWFGALHAGLAAWEHWLHLEPAVQPWHEADVARVCAALGQAACDREMSTGAHLSVDDALTAAEAAVQAQLGVSPISPQDTAAAQVSS